ncbi:MAG: C40 family peptidase [Aquificae bacterium]|nr:C40 family peptidase [Aquificota bacterium]
MVKAGIFAVLLATAVAFANETEILNNSVFKQKYRAVMSDDGVPFPSFQKSIVDLSIGFLGTTYRFGGSSFWEVDCSSFVQKVFRMAGVDLPRTARYQAQFGVPITREELKPGDLLFFRTYARYPSHVGIYIGEGKMIHASSSKKRVIVSRVDNAYFLKRFLFAKRIFLYNPEEIVDEK